GGLVVAALVAGIDVLAYGNPLPAYLIPGAFDFPGGVHTGRREGLRAVDAVLSNGFHQLFGERGVFSYQPVLLLAIPFVLRWRRLSVLDRWSGAAVLLLVAYYATFTGEFGGWSFGFRFLIPLVPLLFWWAARWTWERPRRAWRVVFAALCLVGLITSAIGALNPWPVVYEGSATAPGAVEHYVRSPLLANVLVASFARDPESPAFRALAEHYGPRVTAGYLQKAAINLRRPELLRAATRWARQQGALPAARPPAG